MGFQQAHRTYLRRGTSSSMQRVGFVVGPGFQVMSFAALGAFEFANSSVERRSTVSVSCQRPADGSRAHSAWPSRQNVRQLDLRHGNRHRYGNRPREPRRSRLRAQGGEKVAPRCFNLHRGVYSRRSGPARGRRATTHWCVARELQARYPNVKVDEDRIFIVDARSGLLPGLARVSIWRSP